MMSLRATFCWDIIIMAAGVGGAIGGLGPGYMGAGLQVTETD